MTIALVRPVSAAIARCELTHLEREPIDLAVARAQHGAYEQALRDLGCDVIRLPELPDSPDAVFVEDTVVALDELAIVTRPGAASRRGELASVAARLAEYRPLARLDAPATLDGGDVLVVGKQIFVGASSRSNADAIEQLRALTAPHGYRVSRAPLRDCLHLKSAVTHVGGRRLLINPGWTDVDTFADFDLLPVDPAEAFAANAAWVADTVLYADHFPATRQRLRAHGLTVRTVPATELAKAEGAVTCCSVLLNNSAD